MLYGISGFTSGNQTVSQPFVFSGACASQGQWTVTALQAAQKIADLTLQLKNDANCKGLGDAMRSQFAALDEEFKGLKDPDAATSRMMSLPGEITALRNFISGSAEMKSEAAKLMIARDVENSLLTAKASEETGASMKSLKALGDRSSRAAFTGIGMVDQVLGQLPQLDQCVMGKDAVGQVLSSLVKMSSAFVTAGNGVSSRLANTLSNLSTTLRERKFSRVLKRLNDQQLMTAMSCLTESTAEAYCSARDAMLLFEKGNRSLAPQPQASIKTAEEKVFAAPTVVTPDKTEIKNPFEGYYLLSNQVPLITTWLQRVQIGVDPKIETDADFQNSVLDEFNNHLKRVKAAQGIYNKRRETLKTRTDDNIKRNDVLDMIEALVSNLAIRGGASTNFFIISKPMIEIPFFFVGWVGELPAQVSGSQKNGEYLVRQNWYEWMFQGGKYRDFLNDPDKLADIIGEQLNKLIDLANDQANQFYSKWFIVDKPALVAQALTANGLTVIESLKHIQIYLENFKLRLQKLGGDVALIPVIIDTQVRIQRILESYAKIKTFAESSNASDLSEEQSQRIARAYQDFIDEVFKQFNMRLQRSGFISTRMAGFVLSDYSLMLKKRVDFTPAEEELFYATGDSIQNRMVSLYFGNRAYVKTDLQTALRLNKGNLEATEMLFKDNLIQTMSTLKMIAENKKPGGWRIFWDSMSRLSNDFILPRQTPGTFSVRSQVDVEHPVSGAFLKLMPIFQPFGMLARHWWHSDRYPLSISPYSENFSVDDEFKSARLLLDRMCIQSLAFTDWQAYAPFCMGAHLDPAMDNLSPRDQQRLSVRYEEKALEQKDNEPLNHSLRICAFRDWGRKNLVFQQTLLLGR